MDVFNRTPVNKTAAIVTSQSGCASDNTLSNEQLRENLVAIAKDLDARLIGLPKNSKERKLLGKKRLEVNTKINTLRPAKKTPDVADYFIEAAREMLSKPQFNTLMKKAIVLQKIGEPNE